MTVHSNRRRFAGSRRRLQGNRQRLKGDRWRLEGNRRQQKDAPYRNIAHDACARGTASPLNL